MGQQPGTFSHVTLVDLGGSVRFKGDLSYGVRSQTGVAYGRCLLCPAVRHCI